jgi:hypothetical protein
MSYLVEDTDTNNTLHDKYTDTLIQIIYEKFILKVVKFVSFIKYIDSAFQSAKKFGKRH